jgi:hypothetical protein
VAEEPQQPTPEELLEQLNRLKVTDLLFTTMSTVAQLGYAKLSEEARDLEQAQVAIESLRALLTVLEGHAPEEALRDYRQVVANMQLAYADASG